MSLPNKRILLGAAYGVDVVHILYIVFIIVGLLFIPAASFPLLIRFHNILGFCVLGLQILLGFRCPLSLLSDYLRNLAIDRPLGIYDKPFVVRMLQNHLGFQVPELAITMASLVIGSLCLVLYLLG